MQSVARGRAGRLLFRRKILEAEQQATTKIETAAVIVIQAGGYLDSVTFCSFQLGLSSQRQLMRAPFL